MGIKCRIIRDNKGKVSYVEAPNGNRSKLYDDAIERVGEDSALDIVLTAYTPSFTEEVKNPKRDAFRRQLINRINTLPTSVGAVTLNLEGTDYNLNLFTLEMTTEDLGNGETLMNFTAELNVPSLETKRTNLNDRQYDEVRTPEFMAWSNNWNDVIKDEYGEPQIHYHGTSRENLYEFNSGKGIEFFTSDVWQASRYLGGKSKLIEVYIKTSNNLDTSKEIPTFLNDYIENNIKELDDFLEDQYSTSPIANDWDGKVSSNWKKMSKIERVKYILENTSEDWKILEYPPLLQIIKDNGYTSMSTHEEEGNIGIFDNKNVKSAEENVGTFSNQTADIKYAKGATKNTPIDMVRGLVSKLRQTGLAKTVSILPEEAFLNKLSEKTGIKKYNTDDILSQMISNGEIVEEC